MEGMRFHAFHGCFEQEKREGNEFVVDFRGELDLREAALTDDLSQTADYGKIYGVIAEEMSRPSDLLENVVGRIVRRIASEFPVFERFSVRLSKKNPPVGGIVDWARVTLSHVRECENNG